MSTQTWLIAGLGNPGPKYRQTRHNWGQMALEHIANHGQFPDFTFSQKHNALCASKAFGSHSLVLMFPQTFMNLSGQAIASYANFFKIPHEQILVAQDDLDIPAGAVKLKLGGRSAGQKGIQSTIDQLGAEQFWRLKGGIGRPADGTPIEHYVLQKMPAEQIALLAEQSKTLWGGLQSLIFEANPTKAQNLINALKAPSL